MAYLWGASPRTRCGGAALLQKRRKCATRRARALRLLLPAARDVQVVVGPGDEMLLQMDTEHTPLPFKLQSLLFPCWMGPFSLGP